MSLEFLLLFFQLGIFKGATSLGPTATTFVLSRQWVKNLDARTPNKRRRIGGVEVLKKERKQKPKRTMRHFRCWGVAFGSFDFWLTVNHIWQTC